MAEMRVGKDKEQAERPVSRTGCCGIGAYGIVHGVYLVMKPKDPKPTQTAERIGGFRGCSKCFKPLGGVQFKPGWEIPLEVWAAMIQRVDGKDGCGLTAYYAQQNADGTRTLFDWTQTPARKRLDAGRANVGRILDEQNVMPKGESFEYKRNKQIEKAKQAGLFEGKEPPKPEPKESPRIIDEEPPEYEPDLEPF